MNKTELADELAMQTGITRVKALWILNVITDILARRLNNREKIQLIGFGSLEVRQTPERMARNPKTKEEVLIPKRYKAVFRQSSRLLDKLNGTDTGLE